MRSFEEKIAAFEEAAHFGEKAFDLVSKMEEKVEDLNNVIYKGLGREVAKSITLNIDN